MLAWSIGLRAIQAFNGKLPPLKQLLEEHRGPLAGPEKKAQVQQMAAAYGLPFMKRKKNKKKAPPPQTTTT